MSLVFAQKKLERQEGQTSFLPVECGLSLEALEKELAGPDSAGALRRYDAVLAGLDARLAETLARGLPPEEYERCARLKEANVLARKVLRLAAAQG